ncbi:MAG: hypothetical protein FD155_2893 [Bacteroidetes bacterium]|nr:MAG: hypothetical protein FD155_2893 [Bacteroidota bacterium]
MKCSIYFTRVSLYFQVKKISVSTAFKPLKYLFEIQLFHLILEILAVVKYYSNFAPSKKIVNLE